MAQKKKQPTEKLDKNDLHQRQVIRTPANEVEEIYANSFNLDANPYDFRLLFGLIKRADDDVIEIEDKVSIRMSPQHTKSVAIILSKHVKTYEEKFGNIVVPQDDDNK